MSLEEVYEHKFKVEFNSDNRTPKIYLDGSHTPLKLISLDIHFEKNVSYYVGAKNHLNIVYLDKNNREKRAYIPQVLFDTETKKSFVDKDENDEGLIYD